MTYDGEHRTTTLFNSITSEVLKVEWRVGSFTEFLVIQRMGAPAQAGTS